MIPDIKAKYGHYLPPARISKLVSLAQRCPENWFGKQLAYTVRSYITRNVPSPLDVTIGAIKMRCYFRDNNSERKFVFTPWRCDKQERALLQEALGKEGTFVDIGANVGIYTLSAAVNLGKKGRIIAIEPNPPACQRLNFNVNATSENQENWPRIDILQLGIGEASETVDLYLDPNNLGASSISQNNTRLHDGKQKQAVKIACKPLLQILQEQNVERVNALKIDIEGAEDMALTPFLEAAPDRLLPRLLILENSEDMWEQDLRGAILERGYSVALRTLMNTVYQKAID